MTAKKETYSTRKAWGFGTANNSEAKHFETIANSLRRENEIQREQIKKLQQTIESLRAYQKNHMMREE